MSQNSDEEASDNVSRRIIRWLEEQIPLKRAPYDREAIATGIDEIGETVARVMGMMWKAKKLHRHVEDLGKGKKLLFYWHLNDTSCALTADSWPTDAQLAEAKLAKKVAKQEAKPPTYIRPSPPLESSSSKSSKPAEEEPAAALQQQKEQVEQLVDVADVVQVVVAGSDFHVHLDSEGRMVLFWDKHPRLVLETLEAKHLFDYVHSFNRFPYVGESV